MRSVPHSATSVFVMLAQVGKFTAHRATVTLNNLLSLKCHYQLPELLAFGTSWIPTTATKNSYEEQLRRTATNNSYGRQLVCCVRAVLCAYLHREAPGCRRTWCSERCQVLCLPCLSTYEVAAWELLEQLQHQLVHRCVHLPARHITHDIRPQ